MNAFTIYNYITKLEKENNKLREEIDELRHTIRILRTLEPTEDSESVASCEDINSSMDPDYTDTDSDSGIEVTSDRYLPVITTNTELTRLFHKLARREDNEFKRRAYTRAAQIIEDFPTELTNSSDVAHINGIGKGIRRLIDEYIATGTFANLNT